MAKSKLATPDWIREGFDSKSDWEKAHKISKNKTNEKTNKDKTEKKKEGKVFNVKKCPKCGSYDVGVVLSNLDSEEESNTGKQWECKKCKWKGSDVEEEELSEDEFMKYLDEKGEEVA